MRNDFVALILTHGRPGKVHTYNTLRSHGYTGPILLLVDDEDSTLPEYRARYGSQVVTFSKAKVAETTDEGDNTGDRRCILYARNASFDVAREHGYRYFIQLDDDYSGFYYRFDGQAVYGGWRSDPLDPLFEGMVEFLAASPFLSVAMSQGGDWIGGGGGYFGRMIRTKRKAMNTFVCDVERPFKFFGRINEDVNAYTCLQRRGGPFVTLGVPQVIQGQTQESAGGMTEMYLDNGTYVKSFFSVLYAPSCVSIATLTDPRTPDGLRIHHQVKWDHCAPKILPEAVRKPQPEAA